MKRLLKSTVDLIVDSSDNVHSIERRDLQMKAIVTTEGRSFAIELIENADVDSLVADCVDDWDDHQYMLNDSVRTGMTDEGSLSIGPDSCSFEELWSIYLSDLSTNHDIPSEQLTYGGVDLKDLINQAVVGKKVFM